jgi:hypothetical protein
MSTQTTLRAAAGAAAACAALAFAVSPAWALSVTLNGQPVTFSPPPIERAGRVFVPLRGVFERLGASVVYQNGTINAQGNNRSISLRIGSTQASIDGSPRTLDVAPFIVGASTYVPLRFVSEALGAGVNYDGANQIVALQSANGSAPAPAPAATAPPTVTDVLNDLEPHRAAFVASTKPTISANFTRPVDPNSLHITLDGLDITSASTRSTTGFVYAPPSPLQSQRHQLEVTGTLAAGGRFSQGWAFTSGTTAPAYSLSITAPADGATVSQTFTVSGKAAPNARVHIVAGSTATFGGFAFGTGSYTGDALADAAGNFSQSVSLQTVSGAEIGVTITATDPQTQASAQKKLRLRAQ